MKELTLVLDDEALYTAIETEAKSTGNTVEDVIVEALKRWQVDSELSPEERDELESARREWREKGGVEAHEFFNTLREEESNPDR